MEQIDKLIEKLDYIDGVLFWKKSGKKAGYTNKKGYIEINSSNGKILAHRLIFYMFNGYLPDLIDHIDRDCRNNLINNLREADKRLNSINRELQSNNTTGYKGIFKEVNNNNIRYRARAYHYGKTCNIGSFNSLEAAVHARENFIKNKGLL